MLFSTKKYFFILLILTMLGLGSCSKSAVDPTPTPTPNPSPTAPAFDINSIKDSYADVAAASNYLRWGPYNVHDPSIIKEDDTYYCYNTDVAYGTDIRPGIQIRQSKDLIEWKFYGWVFDGLPTLGANFIKQKGIQPFNSLWAPYIMKVGNEFRLYYSLSSGDPRLSVIGLATASSPLGPWKEQGLVVTSQNDNTRQTNAIDPTVVVTPTGEHYFYYGSAWDGIYMLKLNPATGLPLVAGDKGKRIANRGFTNGQYNGNIEGPEIIYNKELKKYFLFISYDWLATKYNVRVGRSDSPEGPFYDFEGRNLNEDIDHGPMILAPYQFAGHAGWQGVAHCSVFENAGQYYMAHQGRPGQDINFMILHVRKIFWTKDGWPVVSPERYAGEFTTAITKENLVGNWEQVILEYRVVPGYDKEQNSPDFQVTTTISLDANGGINGSTANTWSYSAPWLTMKWINGFTDEVLVERGRDWENKKETILFSGLNNKGTAIWGKKK
ncbi:family 43 glycosylhydrolase [Emticicia sp. ODNR4P]|nr:family 43 glycosylhydrolase [Emticicia sp. ODNR4P]